MRVYTDWPSEWTEPAATCGQWLTYLPCASLGRADIHFMCSGLARYSWCSSFDSSVEQIRSDARTTETVRNQNLPGVRVERTADCCRIPLVFRGRACFLKAFGLLSSCCIHPTAVKRQANAFVGVLRVSIVKSRHDEETSVGACSRTWCATADTILDIIPLPPLPFPSVLCRSIQARKAATAFGGRWKNFPRKTMFAFTSLQFVSTQCRQ